MSAISSIFNLQWLGLADVPGFIIEFFLWLDSLIYSLVGKLYVIFMDLASAEIFNIEQFNYIINNVYIILGVVMLFIAAINIIQYIVNPDKDNGKSLKDLAFKTVRALVLVCLTPLVFDLLYNVQNTIINYNVLPRIFLDAETQESFNEIDSVGINVDGLDEAISQAEENGETLDQETLDEINEALGETFTRDEVLDAMVNIHGNQMAWYTFNGLFYEEVSGSTYDVASRVLGDTAGGTFLSVIGGILAGGAVIGAVALAVAFLPVTLTVGGAILTIGASVGAGVAAGTGISNIAIEYEAYTFEMLEYEILMGRWDMIISLSEYVKSGDINYLFLLSTAAGIFLIYVMFSFCLDLGIRAIKLIFYQLVSPVSFFLSILPGKEDLVKKWFSAVGATWLEVFVRIACICLIIVAVKFIGGIELGGYSFMVKAILIISLLAFTKMVPKLFGDLTGINSGNMKLGIKDKLVAGGGLFAAGAAMTVGAGVLGTVRNVAKSRRVGNTLGQTIRSGLAGGASSAVRTAYNARGAKGFKDVTSAASKGLAGAAKARSDRISYRAKHGGTFAGTMQGHASDFTDWLTGKGVEDLDYVIKVSSDIGKANDDFRAAVKKEWDKHSTDAKIVAKMELKDFKGSSEDQQILFDLYNQYRGQSASTIRQDIEQQREAHRKADYTALARQQVGEMPPPPNRDNFKSSITGEIDENAYNTAVREYQNRAAERDKQVENLARRMSIDAAQRIGYLDSMYNQLEKESITRLGQVALSGEGLGTIKAEDLYSARTAGEYAQDVIRNSGIDLIDPSKDRSHPDYNVTVKNGNYAKFIDDVASAAGKQAVDANREKQRYLDRKSDK